MSSAVRHIFIGDVHGCLDELKQLFKKLHVQAEDMVVLVGDLVAKGPDSQGVVAWAREHRVRSVRGNHDEVQLRYRRAVKEGKEPPHLKKGQLAVAESMTEADWQYLEAMPLFLRLPEQEVIVVHAGVVPGVPLEAQQQDDLLNMRSIRSDGRASPKLDEGRPWASLYNGPDHVVFGHDAVTGLQRRTYATGLDTGCVYGGELTALVLPERKIVSVNAQRVYKDFT